ncbi:MAG: hypothetical protein RRZ24_08430 [Clostridia bacterium]
MKMNDRALESYLYENRVSPTPEFSDRIDAVCDQIRQTESQNAPDSKESNAIKSKRPVRRWVLALVACLLLAVTLIACIPEARAAVLSWIGKTFSIQSYMGQENGLRSPEPQMDAVIRKVTDDGRKIAITDVYDSDEARALADGFGVKLDEVAYLDGTVYITGWFTGTSGKFLLDQWTGGDTWGFCGDWLEGDMILTMPNGEECYGALNIHFTDEASAILQELVTTDENGNLISDPVFNDDGQMVTGSANADARWYQWLESNDVRFVFEAHKSRTDMPAPTGQMEAKLSFKQYYYSASTDEITTLFRADLGTVSIDADAYTNSVTGSASQQVVSFSGVHRFYIEEWEYRGENLNEDAYVNYSVHDLNLSGLKMTMESVAFTPTGPEITIRLDLPESWTRADRISVIRGYDDLVGGLNLRTLLDGEEHESLFNYKGTDENETFDDENAQFLTYKRILCNATIAPSDWDGIKTVTLVPCSIWPTQIHIESVDSTQWKRKMIRLELGVTATAHVNYDTVIYDDADIREDRMDEFAITINLDDYR